MSPAGESRAARLAAAIAEQGLDALIVGDLVRPGDSGADAMANVRWLCGFGGTSGFAIVGREQRTFVTDFRYVERAEGEVDPEFERAVVTGELIPGLAERVRGRIGFDDAQTSVRNHDKLGANLEPGSELVAAAGLVESLRRRKDPEEIERIAAAAALADSVFEWIPERGLAGSTEAEVARDVEARIRDLGAQPSFETIVASGPNGALPHADSGSRVIEAGELVVVDMGAKLDGYCSDGTRTFVTGTPTERQAGVHRLVLEAQLAALAAIRAGVSGVDADAASRAPIVAAGFGDEYGHGLGHGVGLEVHEAPRLSPRSTDVLIAGDIVTVEPGIYLPGELGVRIEDLVVVTDDGVRNLSTTTKELVEVG